MERVVCDGIGVETKVCSFRGKGSTCNKTKSKFPYNICHHWVTVTSKEEEVEDSKEGRTFRINCGSKYFETKYGKTATIKIEEELFDFHYHTTPPTFLYMGRVLAEGKRELLDGSKTYYGKVNGLGEVVHESELGEEAL